MAARPLFNHPPGRSCCRATCYVPHGVSKWMDAIHTGSQVVISCEQCTTHTTLHTHTTPVATAVRTAAPRGRAMRRTSPARSAVRSSAPRRRRGRPRPPPARRTAGGAGAGGEGWTGRVVGGGGAGAHAGVRRLPARLPPGLPGPAAARRAQGAPPSWPPRGWRHRVTTGGRHHPQVAQQSAAVAVAAIRPLHGEDRAAC